MSIHVCKCEHNGKTEYHLRYPGMTQDEAQGLADQINGGTILALRPAQVSTLAGCNCRWDGDTQVEWCELHLAHKEAIHEWAERAKSAEQKLALRPVQVPMTEWQPIETAPLAGPFLAVLDCGGDQTICTMRHGVVASKNSRPDGDFIRERVTHWMPLPPPPKSTYTGITAQAKKEAP